MRIKYLLFLCLIAVAPMITSCTKERTGARREGCQIRVGMVVVSGGATDRWFNAAAWEGVRRAEQAMPICLYAVEPGNPTSIEPAMRALAEKGYDLIIGVAFAQGPILKSVATDYP